MNVERILQIHIGVLTILGALMLGLSQNTVAFPLVMGIAAISAVIFTDLLGWFCVPRVLANLVMIAAAVLCLWNFFGANSQQQLVAISQLLLYVQLTLLFQQKNTRIYGHLAVFSLLQVVIASLLNVRFEFGIILIAYVLVASFAVSLLYLQRAVSQFQPLAGLAPAVSRPQPAQATQDAESLRAALAQPPEASFTLPPTDLRREVMKPGLLSQVAGIALSTLVFTVIFFFGAPRAKKTGWQSPRFSARATTGFCQQINLTGMVNILRSEELVMRVSFRDAQSDEPVLLDGEPYFRGSVLQRYDDRRPIAVWRNLNARPLPTRHLLKLPGAPSGETLVKQVAILEPSDEPVLFTVFPAFSSSATPTDTRYNRFSRQIVRAVERDSDEDQQYHFTLLTNSIVDGKQLDVIPRVMIGPVPVSRRVPRWTTTDAYANISAANIYAPVEKIPGLINKAAELLTDGPTERIAQARKLEAYFRNSGEFTYSLEFENVDRVNSIDPVEDFVVNHKTGHCELFASGLAMMLRSRGIPARIVVGYKGGEVNDVGKFYKVRQNHAHAWVEAYLRIRDMPDDVQQKYGEELIGGWLRLDPTPTSTAPSDTGGGGVVNESVDYAQMLWDNYVLGLDPSKQKELYDPFGDEFAFGDFRFRFDLTALREGRFFNWQAGLIVIGVGFAFVLLWSGVQFVLRSSKGGNRKSSKGRSNRKLVRIEFYERFERLLSQLGLERGTSQTQREFAREAQSRLGELRVDESVVRLPLRLVEVFYGLRFGSRELAESEANRIDDELKRLEGAISATQTP